MRGNFLTLGFIAKMLAIQINYFYFLAESYNIMINFFSEKMLSKHPVLYSSTNEAKFVWQMHCWN